jgi:crotonobetainyl-CoA:carnitine CoA-transferase CaiB-like acyl-CoA transferase
MGRNKKSITLDLNHPKGQEIARRLANGNPIAMKTNS